MRLWKRRSAAVEAGQADIPPSAGPDEVGDDAPAAFRPATAHDSGTPGEPGTPSGPGTASERVSVPHASAGSSWPAPSPGHPGAVVRTVRGRVVRAEVAGVRPAGPTLPAVTTVTAYRRDGGVAGSVVSEGGAYVLDGLPVEPLTLVAVEHPAVHEEVVVRAGDQRRDISLPAFPRTDLQ